MPKKDFLMRILEQLGGLLPYILDLARSGNYGEAHAVIDQAVRELVGVGTDSVVNLPDDVLLDRMRADRTIAWEDKCFFLATVLFEEAEILEREGEESSAYGRRLKSLNLFLILALHDHDPGEFAEITPDIQQLLASLAEYHLPGTTCAYLMQYYEKQGNYAAVEDVLFDWLDLDPTLAALEEPNAVEMGLAFYGRLQNMTDAEIEAGNLSRAEIEAALVELTTGGNDDS